MLTRGDVDIVTERLLPYYRDVYDHVLRATDFADNLRDILSSALEVHLSAVGNRLNEVMKVLTSWAGIILVPTLIAGIYGMNFVHMPELTVALRLSVRAGADGRVGRDALAVLQAPRLALTNASVRSLIASAS